MDGGKYAEIIDVNLAYDIYDKYCDICTKKGVIPLDFDSWLDIELTALANYKEE